MLKTLLKNLGVRISLALLGLALIFLFIQNRFYGYLDENNVLQDSIFLPLGTILLLFSLVGLSVSILWLLFHQKN